MPRPEPVVLHIYDVGTSEEVQAINRFLREVGTGAFHCGVEVYGREWSFTSKGGGRTGIFRCWPRSCTAHSYCESVPVGHTTLSKDDVLRLIGMLEKEWPAKSYNLFTRNCCHFCDELCRSLGANPVPRWVLSLASVGAAAGSVATDTRACIDASCNQCSSAAMYFGAGDCTCGGGGPDVVAPRGGGPPPQSSCGWALSAFSCACGGQKLPLAQCPQGMDPLRLSMVF